MTEHELTRSFPSLEPGLIKEIIEVANLKTLAAGDILMRTGQNIRSTLLVTEGLIKIYREDDQGNDFFMYISIPAKLVQFRWHVAWARKPVD